MNKGSIARWVAIGAMWFTTVIQLGQIADQLSTITRVVRNIDGVTVGIANAMPKR